MLNLCPTACFLLVWVPCSRLINIPYYYFPHLTACPLKNRNIHQSSLSDSHPQSLPSPSHCFLPSLSLLLKLLLHHSKTNPNSLTSSSDVFPLSLILWIPPLLPPPAPSHSKISSFFRTTLLWWWWNSSPLAKVCKSQPPTVPLTLQFILEFCAPSRHGHSRMNPQQLSSVLPNLSELLLWLVTLNWCHHSVSWQFLRSWIF